MREPFAIRSARGFDPATGEVLTDPALVVEGERIAAILPAAALPEGLPVHDFGEATLLPGLIDCHVHLAIETDDYQIDALKRSAAHNALATLRNAQRAAAQGFTTLRVAGDADRSGAWLDVARAIDRGDFPGPRLVGAAHYISPTGGGGDINHCPPEHCLRADGLIADGVDAIRKAVRSECKAGSQWIKVLLSGAYMSQGDDPRRTLYSDDELAALVDEAHRWGRPVMVHAHGADAIKKALRAGARSIEHGTLLDEEAIALFLETGASLVPTLAIGAYYLEAHADSRAQAHMVATTRETLAHQHHWLYRAIAAGVDVVVGSDLGGYADASGIREFGELVARGMTPAEALAAGTHRAARLLGLSDDIGSLTAGMIADVIACHGRPDEDIADLERVVATYCRGGRIVGSEGRMACSSGHVLAQSLRSDDGP